MSPVEVGLHLLVILITLCNAGAGVDRFESRSSPVELGTSSSFTSSVVLQADNDSEARRTGPCSRTGHSSILPLVRALTQPFFSKGELGCSIAGSLGRPWHA